MRIPACLKRSVSPRGWGALQQTARGAAKWAYVRLKTQGQVELAEQGMGAPESYQGRPCRSAVGALNLKLKHKQDKFVMYSLLDSMLGQPILILK